MVIVPYCPILLFVLVPHFSVLLSFVGHFPLLLLIVVDRVSVMSPFGCWFVLAPFLFIADMMERDISDNYWLASIG